MEKKMITVHIPDKYFDAEKLKELDLEIVISYLTGILSRLKKDGWENIHFSRVTYGLSMHGTRLETDAELKDRIKQERYREIDEREQYERLKKKFEN